MVAVARLSVLAVCLSLLMGEILEEPEHHLDGPGRFQLEDEGGSGSKCALPM